MPNWPRMHDIMQASARTVMNGIAVAHTFTTERYAELGCLMIDARYEWEALVAENARLRDIVNTLHVIDIAGVEAFCEGHESGSPTRQQIDALVDACGGIRRFLKDRGEGAVLGRGKATAEWLRKLADTCEREAAEAAEEKANG